MGNHFAARAQVHRDDRNTGGIRLRQDEPESLRDRIQVEKPAGPREQLVLAGNVDGTDVANAII